jgi:hypothetical protein
MSSVQTGLSVVDEVLGLVAGTGQTSPSSLAPEVQAWVASPEQGLVAGIESVSGASDTTETLARLAPSSLTVLDTLVCDEGCWAEVTRAGDGESETCLLGLTCDAAGAVSRLVWLGVPLVAALESDQGSGAPDMRPILEQYFEELQRSSFPEAAAHFTVDTIYSHPPYGGGKERVLYRGRDALLRGFVTDRGPSPVRQVITALWQRGGRVFIEGVIEGIPNGGTFFSTGQASPEGEIARYVAYYSARRIPA